MNLFEQDDRNSAASREPDAQAPLATRMRPRSLKEFVGQEHLLGRDRLLRRMIESGIIGSVIFYGPPSCGKTTLAYVISRETDAAFVVLNAVLDGVKDLKQVVARAETLKKANGKPTILFVDEIHRWNKAQQDALLPHLESGLLTLIGATTENPFYMLVGPLLSRCQLFELYPFETTDISQLIDRALQDEERGLGRYRARIDEEARRYLSEVTGGDVRTALNALEMAVKTAVPDKKGERQVGLDQVKECLQRRRVTFHRDGDEHYHYASAFIKSMRGSDPDAALYWLSAMIESGEDPHFLFRRMLIFASEDVGLADSNLIVTVNALHEAFQKCGMPEGWYFLSHAALYCALAPKSNSASTVFSVHSDIRKKGIGRVPAHLRDKTANSLEARYRNVENPSDDYEYPHAHPKHWVPQQYLPDGARGEQWYRPGTEGYEPRYWQRLQNIIEKKKDEEDT